MSDFVFFSSHQLDIHSLVILFIFFVGKFLVIWSPNHNCGCHAIQSSQKKFSRSLAFRKKCPYSYCPDHLVFFNMASLQHRSTSIDAGNLFKLCDGLMDCSIKSEILPLIIV